MPAGLYPIPVARRTNVLGGPCHVYKSQKTISLFGRFVVPLLIWLIIGPIAAVISWILLKNKGNPKKLTPSIRPNILPRS
jgi:hypothetical protein